MKRSFLLPAFLLLLTGCTEKPILLSPGGAALPADDTFYMAAVQARQPRTVMIEDFTGVSCPPCPAAHETLTGLLTQYPGRVVVMASHVFNIPQAAPVHGASKWDFRTQDGTDLGTSLGGVPLLPVVSVDRVPNSAGEIVQTQGFWSSNTTSRLNLATPVNLTISPVYDEAERTVAVTVQIAYTGDVSVPHNLMLAVVEDGIVDAQKRPAGVDTFYHHNEVLQDIITPVAGVPVLDSMPVKKAGLVFEKRLSFRMDAGWNAGKCRLVACVHATAAADRSVLQAAEKKIQ